MVNRCASQVPAGSDLRSALLRAQRAEEALKASEAAARDAAARAAAAEGASRQRELALEKLRDRLEEKVQKEERRHARDRDAYARIKQAFAVVRREPGSKASAGKLVCSASFLSCFKLVFLYFR